MTDIRTTDPARPVDVSVESTRLRATPRPAGSRFRDVIDGGAGALLDGVESASAMVPGGSVVSAAVRGARTGGGAAGAAVSPEGPGGGAPGNELADLQQTMMMDNMEYLRIQQQMQAENRRFSTLSNVMKARHETAKNSINNIR